MLRSVRLAAVLVAATATLAHAEEPRVTGVRSQPEQQELTPEEVSRLLRVGNQHFTSGTVTSRDHSAQIRAAAHGQFPKAIALSCVDSRVPVEDVFDLGIGDIFVARVAGNFENTDILGSMEFATKVSGAKLILVLGHEDRGLSSGVLDTCDRIVYLPQLGRIGSLNVATAAALAIWEVRRAQWGTSDS